MSMEDVCFLERSRLLYVTVDSSRLAEVQIRTSDFEGGRRVAEDGRVSIWSGAAGNPADVRLGEPEELTTAARARAAVVDLVRPWAGRAQLQYLIRGCRRLCLRPSGGEPAPVSTRVWALLGNVVTPNGRVVPIGLSGQGSGIAELEDEATHESVGKMLEAVDQAEPLPSGSVPAVLASPAAAVVVHEAIGHFAEAAPEGRADVRHRLGVRIAGEVFDIYDDPLAEGGSAHYDVDDDGVVCRGPTQVVSEGRMVGLLHSVASARAADTEPTANGRSASIWDPPIPRMSNLICSAGSSSEDEMLENLGEGLYLHSLAYGFGYGVRLEAQVRLAERVEKGRRTKKYLAGGMVDESRGVLTRAAELGRENVFNRNAMCGKEGQLLYDVGTRAPAMRMTELRLTS